MFKADLYVHENGPGPVNPHGALRQLQVAEGNIMA
jgi:hypothetical protein